jgi:hypothetical protein
MKLRHEVKQEPKAPRVRPQEPKLRIVKLEQRIAPRRGTLATSCPVRAVFA